MCKCTFFYLKEGKIIIIMDFFFEIVKKNC